MTLTSPEHLINAPVFLDQFEPPYLKLPDIKELTFFDAPFF